MRAGGTKGTVHCVDASTAAAGHCKHPARHQAADFYGDVLAGIKRQVQRCEIANWIIGKGVITCCYRWFSDVSNIIYTQHARYVKEPER